MMQTVTTIVTCMTDAERPFLAEALRSVQRQAVPTKIVLCVEENNEWVNEVLAEVQPGIRLMRLPMARLGSVRNSAIAATETDLVAFLDGDDVWEPAKLGRQLDAFAMHKFDVLGAKHVLIREDGVPFFYGFAKRIPMPSSWIGKTELFREIPFEDVQVGEDVLLWERLEPEGRCGILDEFLIRYRVRGGSLSSATPTKRRKGAYARRSYTPGVRPLLLGASYALNVAMRVREQIAGAGGMHVQPAKRTSY
jgi:glycosyltransferase involved in cell wall biosynthesis